MAKFKPCNYDQMVMLPISLENQLVPGSLEHTINELVEKHIKLSMFDARYSNDDTGASAIHPKVLLKIQGGCTMEIDAVVITSGKSAFLGRCSSPQAMNPPIPTAFCL
jgi:hypothetical protein